MLVSWKDLSGKANLLSSWISQVIVIMNIQVWKKTMTITTALQEILPKGINNKQILLTGLTARIVPPQKYRLLIFQRKTFFKLLIYL